VNRSVEQGYAEAAGQEHGSATVREYTKRAGQISDQDMLALREHERVESAARAQRQIELARQAKITMDQAIQTALHESPGTVTEARLIGERGVRSTSS